ncbi:transposase [Endozoicomonas lisbonensis]|uniref:IS701 family transposase n=1 Tax=Endozoicomonas lisbonensis TaxID=3120522 RepID=UPI0033984225
MNHGQTILPVAIEQEFLNQSVFKPNQTKTELAEQMLLAALDQGMMPDWVLGDSVYGESSHLRKHLEDRQQPYVLGITGKHYAWVGHVQKKARALAKELLKSAEWETLSSGAGTKGARLYQWCVIPINGCEPEGWQHSLLFRKPVASVDLDEVVIFRCCAPAHKSSLRGLVEASGQRWAIETCFEEAKDMLGMDQYEVRNWNSWYRHMTLVMLAQTFLALTRARHEKKQMILG